MFDSCRDESCCFASVKLVKIRFEIKMWKAENCTRGWITRIVLVLVCVGIDFAGSQLVINVRNQGGDIVQENIFANVTDDTVSLEFQRSDGTLITQVVDFRNCLFVLCRRIKRQIEEDFIDAAFVSNFDKVKYCIKHGVNVNVIGTAQMVWHNGTTALHLLAEKGDLAIGDYLLNLPGIDANVKNLYGFTPLVLACMANQRRFARLLLRKGANPNQPDRCGKTPLHYCAQKPAFGITFDLLQFKADVNATDIFESTPLSLCMLGDANLLMAKYLIKCGVDLELENNKAVPLIIAVCMKCQNMKDIESVILLLGAGVDVDFQDQNGYTCLHVTAITNYLPLAVALVHKGADITMIDSRSRTAMDVAKAHENFRVAQYLAEQLAKLSPEYNKQKAGRTVTFGESVVTDLLENLLQDQR